jgi:hypothetical protein
MSLSCWGDTRLLTVETDLGRGSSVQVRKVLAGSFKAVPNLWRNWDFLAEKELLRGLN